MGSKHPLADCSNCPLENARGPVLTQGPTGADVALVSRSPGKHDVRTSRPFGGPSGRVLDYLLERHGVKREEIITTNVVLCESDDVPLAAIKACKPRLVSELDSCSLVIAAGTEATSTLTRYKGVTRARGFDHHRSTSSGVSQRVVVTNNPALVLRDSDSFPDLVDDFERAFNPKPPPVFPEVEVIDDEFRGRAALRRWDSLAGGLIASDLEWSGKSIYAAGFSIRPEKSVVFGRGCFDDRRFLLLLKRIYEEGRFTFVWHNGKSDTKILRANGINARIDEDTHLLSYALDERPGYHALEYLLSSKFGWPDYEPESVKKFKKTGELTHPYELYKYNGWDTAGTLALYNDLKPKAVELGLAA